MDYSENNPTDITRNGHTYRYDPDYDCYYRVFSRAEYDSLSHGEKYGWLYVCVGALVITLIGMYVQAWILCTYYAS